MPSYYLSPIGNDQQVSSAGAPLSGGKIFTYLAGTSTPSATYTDNTGATPQANPIILNSLGLPTSPIWLLGGFPLKFVIKDSADVIIRTVDNISGVNDTSSTASEWTSAGITPTYISATQFSVVGDQTAILQVNRRVRTTNTGGLIYGRITVSAFATGITTVTVVNDTGSMDAGLSAVAYGFLSFTPSSVPFALYAAAGANTDITSLGNNTSTIYTTAGTSTAYTITPNPVISAYAIGQSFMVNFNAASGTSPTLQISGIATPPNLVKENADGTYSNIAANDIPINHRSRVTLISTTQALVEKMAPFQSMVRLQSANGYGSTNTAIRRFTTIVTNQGSDITYSDSATLGGTFTINVSGVYSISYTDCTAAVGGGQYGMSLNSTQLTTNINGITAADRLSYTDTSAANYHQTTMWTGYLLSGSVIRAHTSASSAPAVDRIQFTIARVA